MNRVYALPPTDNRPFTVCFWSFRGGVGRTTLAVATATAMDDLTADSVGMLDLDLEAPGFEAFASLAPPSPSQPGFAEYIQKYWDTQCTEAPDVAAFVYRRGRAIMRAGRLDDGYRRVLKRLDWEHLYRFDDGGPLLEDLRAGFRARFGCKYLFVDSRTGVSEIGGVSLGHLADAVVLVFQPTTTGYVEGLKLAVDTIKRRELQEHRAIPRLYVASKTSELFDDELHPEQVETAEHVVMTAEEADDVYIVNEFGSNEYDGGCPHLLFVSLRVRGRSPHDVNSQVDFKPEGPNGYPHWAEPYAVTGQWIGEAEEAVRNALDLRSAVVRLYDCSSLDTARLDRAGLIPTAFRRLLLDAFEADARYKCASKIDRTLLPSVGHRVRELLQYLATASPDDARGPISQALASLLEVGGKA